MEPEVLTLSSDEDEETTTATTTTFSSITNMLTVGSCELNSKTCEPLNPKEPIIEPDCDYGDWSICHKNFPGSRCDFNIENSGFFLTLQCRSVRIGSYNVIPQERLTISPIEIKLVVPPISEGEMDPVTLVIPVRNIRKILGHLEAALPVLFIYLTDPLAKEIRRLLKMNDETGFYFNPCSNEESQKRLTIIPENFLPDTINILWNVFNYSLTHKGNGDKMDLFEVLCEKDANEILVRSSPVEIESLAISSRPVVTFETKTLLVYPPPPNKGGITITVDDYLCLREEQFLNDVLIDFYLKWLHMCHIIQEDRERTHMFSTFFYKRLTAKPKTNHRPHYETDTTLSAAERRHARVQSWTKNVDIFSKDFLLIPINEKSHWFLAVICYPYLNGPVNADTGELIPLAEVSLLTRRVSSRVKKKLEIPIIDDCDWSDRDEADGDDCELDDFDDDDNDPNYEKSKISGKLVRIKQPCILILDSISGSSRSRIVSTLRDYLSVEYTKRKKKSKTYTKDNMIGACPKVPQQMNFTDCGVFTLQYAESFFEAPLKDFRFPIRSLENWFEQVVVSQKRKSIANLIKTLMDELKPNHGINLPSLSLPAQDETAGPNECEQGLPENNSVHNENDLVNQKIETGVSLNDSNSQNCKDDSSSKNVTESLKSCEVELSDVSELTDISRQDTKNFPKISVPLKNLSSPLSTAHSCNGFNNVCKNNDSVIVKNNGKSVTRGGTNHLLSSCGEFPSVKVEKLSNSSYQLLRDNYSDTDDEDDELFLLSKNKKLKVAPVDL